MRHGITSPIERIGEFWRRWKVPELAIFGSFLRDDFGAESDIDFLVDACTGVIGQFEGLVAMEEELSELLNRKVDIGDRVDVEKSPNYLRRRSILSTAEPISGERSRVPAGDASGRPPRSRVCRRT